MQKLPEGLACYVDVLVEWRVLMRQDDVRTTDPALAPLLLLVFTADSPHVILPS